MGRLLTAAILLCLCGAGCLLETQISEAECRIQPCTVFVDQGMCDQWAKEAGCKSSVVHKELQSCSWGIGTLGTGCDFKDCDKRPKCDPFD